MLGVLAAGCGLNKDEIIRELQKQNNSLKVESIGLTRRLQFKDGKIADLEGQLRNLHLNHRIDMPLTFPIDRIELLGITGGADLDGVPGDDAVTVYFRPMDRDGHVLKRGGEIKVKLLDNSTSGEPRVLGMAVVNDGKELRRSWYGRFWTNHYKVVVPFAPDMSLRPNQEVDIHLSFEDFGTGESFTARTAIKVNILKPDEELGP